jgi:hypothetical protein
MGGSPTRPGSASTWGDRIEQRWLELPAETVADALVGAAAACGLLFDIASKLLDDVLGSAVLQCPRSPADNDPAALRPKMKAQAVVNGAAT